MTTVKTVTGYFTVRRIIFSSFCILILLLLLYFSVMRRENENEDNTTEHLNDRPVIGIIAQEVDRPTENQSFLLGASYVKLLESAGARVVPVRVNQTHEEYQNLFNSINGIIYPGGHVNLISSGYSRTAKIFYDLSIEAKKRGDHFPVWGICLGLQMLSYFTSGKLLRLPTNTHGVMLPLTFTKDAKSSSIFKGFPAGLMEELASKPLSQHAHHYGLLMSTYETEESLNKFYKVLSTNTDGETEFASTLEAYDYPIFATQWHPEKNPYEWRRPHVPHSASAAKVSFYMADFFVGEARKSPHRFESEEEENKALIYNYAPQQSDPTPESVYVQVYYL